MDPFRKVKGSPYGGSALHPRGQYSMHPLSVESTVGFRLAVVNDYEMVAGGVYHSPAGAAGTFRIGHHGPASEYRNLGIRLCVDWRQS